MLTAQLKSRKTALASLALAGLAACSSDAPEAAAGERAVATPPVAQASVARSSDPRVVALRQALERSNAALAEQLAAQFAEGESVEVDLLCARLAAMKGDSSGASRLIEAARGRAPADDRVYATAAEIHAIDGRLDTSDTEIKRGVAACGATAALKRARGIHSICQSGGAAAGLKFLESALADDAELPFIARPLGQAYLLVGKARMAEADPEGALEAARASIEHDPEDLDARRFLAECFVAAGSWGDALVIYEELLREGEPLGAEVALLYKNAGMSALVQKKRDVALRSFLRARELGLDDVALSTGATVLLDEATSRVDAARQAIASDESQRAKSLLNEALTYQPHFAPARAELASLEVQRGIEALNTSGPAYAIPMLEAALEWDPESLEAHNYLGHARYRSADFAGAAEAWSFVVDTAQLEKIELPDPVHLALARAQFEGGQLDQAYATLEGYLLSSPTGTFVEETRKVLAALPPKEAVEESDGSDG